MVTVPHPPEPPGTGEAEALCAPLGAGLTEGEHPEKRRAMVIAATEPNAGRPRSVERGARPGVTGRS